jgi:hypothetical protein
MLAVSSPGVLAHKHASESSAEQPPGIWMFAPGRATMAATGWADDNGDRREETPWPICCVAARS